MKKMLCVAGLAVVCSLLFFAGCNEAKSQLTLEWSQLPSLPPAPGEKEQEGYAGPFAGVSNDALIVAGGANFQKGKLWQGGKKLWWDNIFVLVKTENGKYQWITDPTFKLPRPLAYGVSVSTPDGLICIGGCDEKKSYSDVFIIKYNREAKKIEIENLPSLPKAMCYMDGDLVGNTIYIAGGSETIVDRRATKNFFALDLSKKGTADFAWRQLPSWPGPARLLPVTAGQSNGSNDCFYLFSGRDNSDPNKETQMRTDSYCYNPKTEVWTELTDILGTNKNGTSGVYTPSCAAMDVGKNNIIIIGGDSDKSYIARERLTKEIKQTADKTKAAQLTAKLNEITINHPGFSKDILIYDTITDKWAKFGEFPTTSHGCTVAFKWDGDIVIACGEFKPGVRTPKVWKAKVSAQ